MPITPSSFKRYKKPCTFEFAGEPVHIEYYPASFGQDALDKWNAIAAEVNAAEDDDAAMTAALGFGALICEMVASWDYCEDPDPEDPEGKPGPAVPLTPERILAEFQRYPLFFPEFLRSIIEAIGQDATRGKGNGTASPEHSGAISSQMAKLTSSPVKSSRHSSVSSSSRAG